MNDKIYTVSELNQETARLLEAHFFYVQVEGEISNLSMPASGHFYFTLKDAAAQVRCAMFRSAQRKRMSKPENGMHVVVRAQVGLYEPRGDYQLIVDNLEAAGDGALLRAFEALKAKLSAEGLFASAHKKPIPTLPSTIGVITSPTGAAIRDILTTLKRRFPSIPVILYPVSVQGESAQFDIERALRTANNLKQCDVLLLARGGGSLEDLWAFNEERVARAIYASAIPVISGVGHETDVTIADFVADLRAATPTAAAEHAAPDHQQWLAIFLETEQRLYLWIQRHLRQNNQRIDWLSGRLLQQHPQQKMARNRQQLGDYENRLQNILRYVLNRNHTRNQSLLGRLWQASPNRKLDELKLRQEYLLDRLQSAERATLNRLSGRLVATSQTMNAVSPLATLNRGYALVNAGTSGDIIRSTSQVQLGDKVTTRLAQGEFVSQVVEITPE